MLKRMPPVEVPGLLGRLLAFAVPVALLGLLALGYAGVERSRVAFDQNQARALQLLVALSDAASQVGTDQPKPLQEVVQRVAVQPSPLRTLWMITEKQVGAFVFQKARTYVVHSDPALGGKALDKDQVRDKGPYDISKDVELRFEKHGLQRKDLTYVVNTSPDGLRLEAAGPVVRDGKLMGTMGLTLLFERPTLPLPWQMVLVICLSAIALAALIFRFVPAPRLSGVLGVLVMLGTCWMLYGQASGVVARSQRYATDRLANDLISLQLAAPPEVQTRTLVEAASTIPGPGRKVESVVQDSAAAAPGAGAQEGRVQSPLSPATILGWLPSEVRSADAAVQGLQARVLLPEGSNPYLSSVASWLGWTTFLLGVFFVLGFIGYLQRFGRMVRQHAFAYGYAAPAMLGMAIFVFFPFISGFIFSFFEYVTGDDLTNTVTMFGMNFKYMGLDNFFDILGSREYSFSDARNFYFTLVVTILWTGSNVFLHVSIGLALALLLKNQWLKLKGIYRVLLIVPWAVPNYITALIWRGMFDVEFGTVNYVFSAIGIGKVAWWSSFWTAFAANLATNVWLGFPFMMVISLGALQSIPGDLYEAAEVDGASRWQQFKQITLPLLKPALFPAVILGTIWTFNMFNVIYLVSGGAPEHKTDILITQAYRFAFEGARRYGYAAAYAVIIFVILLVYGTMTNRVTKASEGAFD